MLAEGDCDVQFYLLFSFCIYSFLLGPLLYLNVRVPIFCCLTKSFYNQVDSSAMCHLTNVS